MKFSIAFFVAALPLLAAAAPSARFETRQNRGGNRGQQGQQAQNKGQQAATTAAAAAATQAANNGQNNAGQGNAVAGGDPQTSQTLLQSIIATGFAKNGQEVPTEGQVASLTSTNNFINFCATTGKPITNGQQIKTGSCNPAPMGVIAATTNMPSCKFQFPKNGATIAANTNFTLSLAVKHLDLGHFTNAQSTYYAAPQTVNAQGDIIGHTHVTIEKLTSLDQTTPGDPNVFQFFKGVNQAANAQGVVTVDVPGVPPGVYKLSTIQSSSNHQPVLVAVAQHASLDDTIYFTATAGGAAATGANNGQAGAATGANNGQAGAAAGANNGQAGAAAGANNGQAGAATGANNGQAGAATGANNGQAGAAAGANNGQAGAATGANNGQAGAATGANNGQNGAATGANNGQAGAATGANNGQQQQGQQRGGNRGGNRQQQRRRWAREYWARDH